MNNENNIQLATLFTEIRYCKYRRGRAKLVIVIAYYLLVTK